jgi:hypothetical protein
MHMRFTVVMTVVVMPMVVVAVTMVVMRMVAAGTMHMRFTVVMSVRMTMTVVVVMVMLTVGAVHVLHDDSLARLGGRTSREPHQLPELLRLRHVAS